MCSGFATNVFLLFFFSFLVVLAFGVKESMSLNNLFTAINVTVVLFVIVAGSFKGKHLTRLFSSYFLVLEIYIFFFFSYNDKRFFFRS